MKNFKVVAAQGEITVVRIGPLLKSTRPLSGRGGLSPMSTEGGRYVVGHSETGHHHVVAAAGAEFAVLDRPPEGMRVLRAILTEPAKLEHLRGHDTHEPLLLEPGEYEFRIAREYDPYAELARQSAD